MARRGDQGRRLRVEGTMECNQGGHVLELEPVSDGIIDDPTLVTMRLRITEPEIGTPAITQETVVWEGGIGDEDTVIVRVDDGPDERLSIRDE